MSKIVYEWSDAGKLEIGVRGNDSSTLRFTPSEEAVLRALQEDNKGTRNVREAEDIKLPTEAESSPSRRGK